MRALVLTKLIDLGVWVSGRHPAELGWIARRLGVVLVGHADGRVTAEVMP